MKTLLKRDTPIRIHPVTLKSNIHYEYEYDEHGNIIKKTKYAEDNNTWRICTTWISEYEEYIISER